MKNGDKYKYWNEGNYPHEWREIVYIGQGINNEFVFQDVQDKAFISFTNLEAFDVIPNN